MVINHQHCALISFVGSQVDKPKGPKKLLGRPLALSSNEKYQFQPNKKIASIYIHI